MAGSEAVIEIRQLFSLDEFKDVLRLQKTIWGFDDVELLPLLVLAALPAEPQQREALGHPARVEVVQQAEDDGRRDQGESYENDLPHQGPSLR